MISVCFWHIIRLGYKNELPQITIPRALPEKVSLKSGDSHFPQRNMCLIRAILKSIY